MALIRNTKDPDANPLYSREGNVFTDALFEFFDSQQLNHKNKKIMNNENFQYLGDNIKYMAFGEDLKAN